MQSDPTTAASCPVNSHNEWDPLEEVIIGRLEHAYFPDAQLINQFTMPTETWTEIYSAMGTYGGVPYPDEMIEAAQHDLNAFIHILEAEGVRVRYPDEVDYARPFASPDWQATTGFSTANPRDPFMIIGNEILEAPMADRSRYFEAWAYRSLFKEYFKAGARWTAAPRPQLLDELFKELGPEGFEPSRYGERLEFAITEFEPTFDAADFVRCGRDIFGQKSHVTNDLGILWLQRHLGSEYRVHIIESRTPYAMHIDTTLMPLAPGKVLVNPEFLGVENVPAVFKHWDILEAPQPVSDGTAIGVISGWANMNMLMLDEERVIVEEKQEPMIQALKNWGFKPIPCPFQNYYAFMGGFHCATLDVRRRGTLQSYFD